MTFVLGLAAPYVASLAFPRLASGWIERIAPLAALEAPANWQSGECLSPPVAGFDGQTAAKIVRSGSHERADDLLHAGSDPWREATLNVTLLNARSDAHIVVRGVRLLDVQATDTAPDWVVHDDDECGGEDTPIALALHLEGGRGHIVATPDDNGSQPFPFTLTPDEVYTLALDVDADAHTYDFTLAIDYLVNGSSQSLTIAKNERPFRIVGNSPSTGEFSVWNDGTVETPGG